MEKQAEDRQITDPDHIVCLTDDQGGLCAVADELIKAGWNHAVAQRHAGSEDWPEMYPMLVSFMGGVQHYLGRELDPNLTANEWHLLQSMLQQRIRESEMDGIGKDHPGGQAQRELSRKLLHHELRMQRLETPEWGELPEPLASMSYSERLRLTSTEWLAAWGRKGEE